MILLETKLEENSDGNCIFYAGHTLKGVVELTIDHTVKCTGIYVIVHGRAKAHWTETRTVTTNGRNDSSTDHFMGEKIYLNLKAYVFGSEDGPTIEMQPGIHSYDFAFELPNNLPYSLKVKHGVISYHVKTVLEVPSPPDKEKIVPFIVKRIDDLNLYPDLKIGRMCEDVKRFSYCLCFLTDPLNIAISVPYTGFVRGQKVPVKINYVNKSDTDVVRTIIKLKREIFYISDEPEIRMKHEVSTLVTITASGAKTGQSKIVEEKLKIPNSVMNSNKEFCKIIDISYCITIESSLDGEIMNPMFNIPIKIGSIPLFGGLQAVTPEHNTRPSTPASNRQSSPLIPNARPSMPVPNARPSMPVPERQQPAPGYRDLQPSAPVEEETNDDDLPPSYFEAMSMLDSIYPSREQQPITSNIGWSIPMPSSKSNNNS